MCIKKIRTIKLITLSLSAYFNALVYNAVHNYCLLIAVYCFILLLIDDHYYHYYDRIIMITHVLSFDFLRAYENVYWNEELIACLDVFYMSVFLGASILFVPLLIDYINLLHHVAQFYMVSYIDIYMIYIHILIVT